jgi:hypothetical protein
VEAHVSDHCFEFINSDAGLGLTEWLQAGRAPLKFFDFNYVPVENSVSVNNQRPLFVSNACNSLIWFVDANVSFR